MSPETRIVTLLCLAEALSMTGFAAYPAILPMLSREWGMNGGEAGFIGGAFFFGYMLAVPILSGLTDRFDARIIFASSCGLASLGIATFALSAHGVISGALCQAIVGAGLAGTYMPGLKALTDRVCGPYQARYIAFYTSTFGIGTSLSLLSTGYLVAALPWHWAFGILACGPVLAALTILLGVSTSKPQPTRCVPWFPSLGILFQPHEARRYILGYALHCWELFGLRSWMVAFIAFAYGTTQTPLLSATEAAALINLFGLPASILGNEAAAKLGRTRWIAGIMAVAGVLCWIAGIASAWSWWPMLLVLGLYFICIMADSAALTVGMIQATPVAERGAVMGVYSLLGFGAGSLSPLLFGIVLDSTGIAGSSWAWILAFGTLGSGGLAWSIFSYRNANHKIHSG